MNMPFTSCSSKPRAGNGWWKAAVRWTLLTGLVLLVMPSSGKSEGAVAVSRPLALSEPVLGRALCKRELGRFFAYCDFFHDEAAVLRQRGLTATEPKIRYAWFDFDSDGQRDLFLRIESSLWCGTAGCANVIVFADALDAQGNKRLPHTSIATSSSEVFLDVGIDGNLTLRFGDSGHTFDVLERKRFGAGHYE